jgi:hypothetical protein
MSVEDTGLLRLSVIADADPSALINVLGRLQNLNVVPQKVLAECASNHTLHIAIDVVGLSDDKVTLITRKVGQAPSIVNAHWHRL